MKNSDQPFGGLGLLVAFLLLMGAVAIRLVGVDGPLTSVHPTRQYRSALIARSVFLEHQENIEPWRLEVAREVREGLRVLEPAIFEHLAGWMYIVWGAEVLWAPRVVSALLWGVGGLAVLAMARRQWGANIAILSAAVFWFAPLGIVASRSFQPDAPMTVAVAVSLCAVRGWCDTQKHTSLVVGLVAGGMAVCLKPMALFVLVPAIGWMVACGGKTTRHGWRGTIAIALMSLALMLTGGWWWWVEPDIHSWVNFIQPELWLDRSTWMGALRLLRIGYSPLLLVLALCGVALSLWSLASGFSQNRMRHGPGLAMFVGYVAMGMCFGHHFRSHDYYHLLAVLWLAFGIGGMAAWMQERWWSTRTHVGSVCVPLSAVLLAGLCSWMAWPSVAVVMGEAEARNAKEIGELVKHSRHVVVLGPGWGNGIRYHGELAGPSWPSTNARKTQEKRGREVMAASDQMALLVANHAPEYFVVADLSELQSQPGLVSELARSWRPLSNTDTYQIYVFAPEQVLHQVH